MFVESIYYAMKLILEPKNDYYFAGYADTVIAKN